MLQSPRQPLGQCWIRRTLCQTSLERHDSRLELPIPQRVLPIVAQCLRRALLLGARGLLGIGLRQRLLEQLHQLRIVESIVHIQCEAGTERRDGSFYVACLQGRGAFIVLGARLLPQTLLTGLRSIGPPSYSARLMIS